MFQIGQQTNNPNVTYSCTEGQTITRTKVMDISDRISTICGELLTCCGFCCCHGNTDKIRHAIAGQELSETITVEPTQTHTEYGTEGIEAYIRDGHGPNGRRVLDHHIREFIQRRRNSGPLLDAGCNGGEWPFYAGDLGIEVYGNDIQNGMIIAAKKRAVEQDLMHTVNFMVGDVTRMPAFNNAYFATALSVLVGCNLCTEALLKSHIEELFRVMRIGGKAMFVAPESLDKIFTNGKQPLNTISTELQQQLDILNHNRSTPLTFEEIRMCLISLSNVLSATFVIRNNALVHVSDLSQLAIGGSIIRKLPNNVIPNHYYPTSLYESLFDEVGFTITQARHDRLSEEERVKHNGLANDENKLGSEYVQHSIFAVWELEKKPVLRLTAL